ncbi:MAG: amino acid permease, partial [Deltaproteobacteria bacterium]
PARAAANAGPAVVLSFILSALAAALAGLCYAEMASMAPIAGSAYTYAYVTLGEIVAFMIGWDLILEYGVAASTVAVGWSGYLNSLLQHAVGLSIPAALASAPLHFDVGTGTFSRTQAIVNAPAVLILAAVTLMLRRGLQLSLRLMSYAVVLKLAVIGTFIVSAARFVRPDNWHPFIPENAGTFGVFGWSGVLQGATMLFFAYGGFDAVSTAAAECRQPQRDIPLGMFGSLLIAVSLYVAVALVLVGVVPYTELSVPDPMAVGMAATGQAFMEYLIEVGAICGLFSVLTVQIYGQTRILYAMALDGLLPRPLTRLHPRLHTPATLTTWIGALAAV